MKRYTVKSPLEHDKERYAIDAEVELDEKHAAPLLAAGVIVAKSTPQPSSPLPQAGEGLGEGENTAEGQAAADPAQANPKPAPAKKPAAKAK
jgi:hypothetical protein